jgi:hypothetical protein
VEFQPDSPDGAEELRRHVLKIGRGGRAAKPLDEASEELTPVMTRLGPADLATVDTLITAGIAGSRAEVLRWAAVIEPGELYLLVILGQHGATREAWTEEHFHRLRDFRAQRLPEVKGFMVTTDARDSAGRPPSRIMIPVGISLLDPEEDEIARGLTPVTGLLGPVDLEMLDALITAGTAASRAEAVGWVLARIRERPPYARLSERARELDELKAHF